MPACRGGRRRVQRRRGGDRRTGPSPCVLSHAVRRGHSAVPREAARRSTAPTTTRRCNKATSCSLRWCGSRPIGGSAAWVMRWPAPHEKSAPPMRVPRSAVSRGRRLDQIACHGGSHLPETALAQLPGCLLRAPRSTGRVRPARRSPSWSTTLTTAWPTRTGFPRGLQRGLQRRFQPCAALVAYG